MPEEAIVRRGSVNHPNRAVPGIKAKKSAPAMRKSTTDRPDADTDAEKRLQSLLKEMEKIDQDGEDSEEEYPDADFGGPGQRFSDDTRGTD